MAIVRFEPFRDLMSLQDRMNRLFHESYRSQTSEDDWALGGTWAPAVDIYEQENNIVIKAELPGVDPKDVDIRLDNNILTIKGERKARQEHQQGDYFQQEVCSGAFARTITLPEGVNADEVKARYHDGVLEISMPAPASVASKKVPIEIAGEERKQIAA